MPLNFPSTGLTANQTTYSFSGNTWIWNGYAWDSVSTGAVSSVNGATGAIVSVAVTGSNTFTGLQTMTAGITASNLYVSSGATFAGRSSFTSGLTTSNLWVTNGVTFASNISAPNVVYSFNGLTGTVTYSTPIASSSVTGVASFGNEFTVSALGAVGLTSNYVKSFNGSTGTVTYAPTLASSSATGVASFGNEFVVSAAGAVGLTSNYVKSVNGITGAVGITAGSNITITQSGLTFTISSSGGGGSSPLASSSVTGVASFGNQFVVSALGAVSLTSNYVSSVNGLTGAVTISAGGSGMTSTVANTFSALQTFTAGITANALYVSGGATFASRSSFNAGLTASTLYVSGSITGAGTVSLSYPNVESGTNNISLNGNGILIKSPAQQITIGDTDGVYNSTTLTVDDFNASVSTNVSFSAAGNIASNSTVIGTDFADTYSKIQTYRTTTSATTANQTIATVTGVYSGSNGMLYPAFEVTVSAWDTVALKGEMLKMLVVQDGTNTVNTQYGLIRTGATGPVSSYSTGLTNASYKSLLIRATPLSANSTNFTTTVRAIYGV